MHKNQARKKSNQALLARIKKEMDEPRMAASTREETVSSTKRPEPVKLPVIQHGRHGQELLGSSKRREMLPRSEDNGKAHQGRSG
jgi:hypothetical protein